MTLENFNYRTNPLFLRNQSFDLDDLGIPFIPKVNFNNNELCNLRLLSFNQMKKDNGKHNDRIVHFFLYDYNFETVWNNPEPFIDTLKQYTGVLTPDFSMYIEMPIALQIFNTFRNRWCGAYFSSKGIKVIPTVNWGEKSSFDFCFKGIEKGSVVAVSTYMYQEHGNHGAQKDIFMNGYNEMLRQIQPEQIICYSEPFPEMKGNIITIDYELSSWKHLNDDINLSHKYSSIRSIITKYGYVCKGSGSAYGGQWKPKKPADNRFIGKPGQINISYNKNGDKYETLIGSNGLAKIERHWSDHKQPWAHTNPHDHYFDWSNGYPNLHSKVIQYSDPNNIPILKRYKEMVCNMAVNIFDNDKFESISDYKWCVSNGGEVEFEYHNKQYSITSTEKGIHISEALQQDTEKIFNTADKSLEYIIDGERLHDIIKDIKIIVRTI